MRIYHTIRSFAWPAHILRRAPPSFTRPAVRQHTCAIQAVSGAGCCYIALHAAIAITFIAQYAVHRTISGIRVYIAPHNHSVCTLAAIFTAIVIRRHIHRCSPVYYTFIDRRRNIIAFQHYHGPAFSFQFASFNYPHTGLRLCHTAIYPGIIRRIASHNRASVINPANPIAFNTTRRAFNRFSTHHQSPLPAHHPALPPLRAAAAGPQAPHHRAPGFRAPSPHRRPGITGFGQSGIGTYNSTIATAVHKLVSGLPSAFRPFNRHRHHCVAIS